MVSREEYDITDSDHAIRIDLMTKVFGINAAERYFEGLPPSAKTAETYTALLHSYAACKLTERAEDLFERTKEANLSLSAVTYNELMTLYTSVGQLDKIPSIYEEMERQEVAPDLFTYNLLLSSSAASLNIDEVQRILEKMSGQSDPDESWLRYINLVKVYISSGQLVNSDCNSLVESEKSITQREWITYDFLVILYGGMGNKDKLDQIWKSLISTKQKMIGRNYACIIASYLMLGHSKDVKEILQQWKQSTTTEFDVSVCSRLLSAFGEVGLSEEAAAFHLLLLDEKVLTD
ncbi:OLC1v1002709C2 [Oldenlandia corymbosa var. corymbosa]|nr:OLC1v1002709C2 [Oldenlandia corymbosa var. corymbosa]